MLCLCIQGVHLGMGVLSLDCRYARNIVMVTFVPSRQLLLQCSSLIFGIGFYVRCCVLLFKLIWRINEERCSTQGMSIEIITTLGSNLASVHLKKIQTPHSFFCNIAGDNNFHNLLVRQQSSSLSPSYSPCLSFSHYLQGLFQKATEDQ